MQKGHSAPQKKKKTGLIVGIMLGWMGVLVVVFLIMLSSGVGGMTCTTSADFGGATMNQSLNIYFGGEGGTVDKVDLKMTTKLDKSSADAPSIDVLYESLSQAANNTGIPGITTRKQGDSVVVEAKGIKGSDLYRAGVSLSPDSSFTREELKKQMEGIGYRCN